MLTLYLLKLSIAIDLGENPFLSPRLWKGLEHTLFAEASHRIGSFFKTEYMLNGLDLFSGIGGITLALKEWVRPVAYCENDRYAQGVILSRISSGDLPNAPIWDDVRTLQGSLLPRIDIIYAGFPCQDISIAGNGKGLEGERSGLFFEVMRLAEEIKPKFIFLENVTNIRTKGLFRVVGALVDVGYDCRWDIFSARSIGADHNRRRWFLLAHSKHNGSHESEAIQSTKKTIQNNQKGKNKTFELKGSI